MIPGLLRPALLLALGTVVAGSLLLYAPLDRGLVLDAYLVFAGGVVLLALVAAAARSVGGESDAFERALRRAPARPRRPEQLLRLESKVTLAAATATDFHFGLRPQLREAAAHRLRSGLGIDLDADPERAARVLGPLAWGLVRPDREPPAERFGPGETRETLHLVLRAIEAVRR